MKTVLGALLLCMTSAAARADDFMSTKLSKDQKHLEITTTAGGQFEAPLLPDQVGFQHPKISPNGKYVGWLALFENCCTSYPIPFTLVVLDAKHKVHQFNGIKLATFQWCFLPDSRSNAYMQTKVHGTNYEHFERRIISDGRLTEEYDYPDERAENEQARSVAPNWVKCVPE